MPGFQELSKSRREFLRTAALATAAVASGSAFSERTEAAIPAAMGKAKAFDLGMAPHKHTAGAVIVLSEWGTYVTFPDQIAGTAVVELVGCAKCTHSYSTDLGHDGRPYSYFGLKPGAVFEVANSPWLLRTEEDIAFHAPKTTTRGRTAAKAKPLRHFVFTFHDTTYQCIAEGLHAKLCFGNYGDIAAQLFHSGLPR